MHVKFYHRVCFQSTWRGGLEGGEHYYSPPGVSPPLRGHHHKAGSRMGWMRPGPSSPGGERWLVNTTHCVSLLDMPLDPPHLRAEALALAHTPAYWLLWDTWAPYQTANTEHPQHLPCMALFHGPHHSPLESHLRGGKNVLFHCPAPISAVLGTVPSIGKLACL